MKCPAGSYCGYGPLYGFSYYTDRQYYYDSCTCYTCPDGWYSNAGDNHCTACPFGTINTSQNNAGKGSCASVVSNVAVAFIVLFFAFVGLVWYVCGGRLQRMAFVRKERLIKTSNIMLNLAFDQLLKAGELCSSIVSARRNGELVQMAEIGQFLKRFSKWIMLILFGVIVFCGFMFASIIQVFFTALIIWRGYTDLPNYTDRITDYVEHLSKTVSMEWIYYVFYPFIKLLEVISSFSFNLGAVNVSCYGCQAVTHLFLDFLVAGLVVIIILSDMEVYWSTALAKVNSKFRSLLYQKTFWASSGFQTILVLAWSSVLSSIPRPRKVLQYALSLVQLMVFFENYGIAKYSGLCDAALYGLDFVLAFAASLAAYLSIIPLTYLLSQVLVPQFKLQPGTVNSELAVRRHASRRADKLQNRCPKCDLGLHRHYTSHFGKLHCDCPQHQEEISNPILPRKKFVVYGCPSMEKCNWAVCDVCYELHYTAKCGSVDLSDNSSHASEMSASTYTPSTDDELRRSSVAEKQERIWTRAVPYLKMFVMILSLDWFYIKITFEFGQLVFNRMMLVNEKLIASLKEARNDTSESTKLPAVDVPKLPWLYALRKKFVASQMDQIFEDSESESLHRKWSKYLENFPTFYRMLLTVREDLMPRRVHANTTCHRCKSSPIVGMCYTMNDREDLQVCELCRPALDKDGSVTKDVRSCFLRFYDGFVLGCTTLLALIPFGSLLSEKGRRIWARVCRNYLVFARITFGYWTVKATRDFDLKTRFDELKEETETSDKAHNNFVATVKLTLPPTTSDLSEDRLNLISSLVSSRLVLLQLVPYLTILSVVAVDISGSPVLIFDPELVTLLPPLFMFNAFDVAKELLVEMGSGTENWKIRLMAVYLCVEKSRSIQFLLHLFSCAISITLDFASDEIVWKVNSASFLMFAVTSLIQSIYPLLLLHKLLFPPQAEGKARQFSTTKGVELGKLGETGV